MMNHKNQIHHRAVRLSGHGFLMCETCFLVLQRIDNPEHFHCATRWHCVHTYILSSNPTFNKDDYQTVSKWEAQTRTNSTHFYKLIFETHPQTKLTTNSDWKGPTTEIDTNYTLEAAFSKDQSSLKRDNIGAGMEPQSTRNHKRTTRTSTQQNNTNVTLLKVFYSGIRKGLSFALRFPPPRPPPNHWISQHIKQMRIIFPPIEPS